MLDESPVQPSGRVVADLDRPHLQDVAGFMESREPWPKHNSNSARPRLVVEMGWLHFDCLWYLHAFLREEFSATTQFGPLPNKSANCGGKTGESARFLDDLTIRESFPFI